METKPSWQSKTLILNLIAAVSAIFIPAVQVWIAAHPVELATGFAILNMGLRIISKGKIEIA